MTSQEIYNKRRLDTLALIEANPDHWDQSQWHCGTSHCFAGFGDLLKLSEENKCDIGKLMETSFDDDKLICVNANWYGLSKNAWFSICHPFNTLDILKLFIKSTLGCDYINLSGMDLSNVNLSNANLSNADLSNANLSNANLSNANLSNANLSNANLSKADLSNANLLEADLSGADLNGAKR